MRTLLAFLWVALPKVMAGGGQFALNMFLIRHFGPEDFGALSVCLTAILLLDSFLGSAIDMAVLRLCPSLVANGEAIHSLQIQKAGLLMKPLAIGLVSLPVLIFSGALSKAFLQREAFAHLIMLTVLALVAMLVLRSVQTYFQVAQKFQWYGSADLVHNLLRYGFVAYAAAAGFVTPGLVLGTYAVAPMIVSALLLLLPAKELLGAHANAAAASEIGNVLAWFVPAAAVGGLTSRMDVFFVAHLAGVREAGLFTAAQSVGLPILLLGTYLSVVFGPRIMTQFEDGSLRPFYLKFQLSLTAIAAVSYMLLILARVWFGEILFPPKFHQSSQVLLVLYPSYLSGLISFPLTISLVLFLKPRFLFLIDACAIPLLCAAYFWTVPRYGALGAATLTTSYSLLKLGILQIVAWKLFKSKGELSSCSTQLEFSEGF